MSKVHDLVETFLIRAGKNAVAKLAIAAGCSERVIYNLKNGHLPKPEIVYRLAKACGLNEDDALALAKGCASEIKETA